MARALGLGILVAFGMGLTPARAADPAPTGQVMVFAAASLTAAFRDLAPAFEQKHPGTRVETSFAGSSTLVQQIEQGAPADVFASANEAHMKRLADQKLLAGSATRFARNLLEIAVEAGNPHGIRGLPDLAKPGLVVVLAGPTVPAGQYAIEAFEKAGVTPPEGSRELDVKAVLSRVALGEADAGVVYVTDVKAAATGVEGVTIPEEHNVVAHYPIAALHDAPNAAAARAFAAFVLSTEAQAVLERYGFLPP
jgi:molybdate transport system substrate-binding protein